jgi:hypothetical protein
VKNLDKCILQVLDFVTRNGPVGPRDINNRFKWYGGDTTREAMFRLLSRNFIQFDNGWGLSRNKNSIGMTYSS